MLVHFGWGSVNNIKSMEGQIGGIIKQKGVKRRKLEIKRKREIVSKK